MKKAEAPRPQEPRRVAVGASSLMESTVSQQLDYSMNVEVWNWSVILQKYIVHIEWRPNA